MYFEEKFPTLTTSGPGTWEFGPVWIFICWCSRVTTESAQPKYAIVFFGQASKILIYCLPQDSNIISYTPSNQTTSFPMMYIPCHPVLSNNEIFHKNLPEFIKFKLPQLSGWKKVQLWHRPWGQCPLGDQVYFQRTNGLNLNQHLSWLKLSLAIQISLFQARDYTYNILCTIGEHFMLNQHNRWNCPGIKHFCNRPRAKSEKGSPVSKRNWKSFLKSSKCESWDSGVGLPNSRGGMSTEKNDNSP